MSHLKGTYSKHFFSHWVVVLVKSQEASGPWPTCARLSRSHAEDARKGVWSSIHVTVAATPDDLFYVVPKVSADEMLAGLGSPSSSRALCGVPKGWKPSGGAQ